MLVGEGTYIPHVSRPVLGMYVCLYVCVAN